MGQLADSALQQPLAAEVPSSKALKVLAPPHSLLLVAGLPPVALLGKRLYDATFVVYCLHCFRNMMCAGLC